MGKKKTAKQGKKTGRGGARKGAGRPRSGVETVLVSAGLPAPLAAQLDQWCQEHDCNRNQAIRRAIAELVE